MMTDATAGTDEMSVETDISSRLSQISEIKDTYERKSTALQSEIIELKDLMLAMMDRSNEPNQSSGERGPSKQPLNVLDNTCATFCEM